MKLALVFCALAERKNKQKRRWGVGVKPRPRRLGDADEKRYRGDPNQKQILKTSIKRRGRGSFWQSISAFSECDIHLQKRNTRKSIEIIGTMRPDTPAP
jgi:hypothetical protein